MGVKPIKDIFTKMKATGPRKWQKEPKVGTNWFFSVSEEVLLDTFETY